MTRKKDGSGNSIDSKGWFAVLTPLIIWIVSILVGIGVYIGMVLSLKESMNEVKESINHQKIRVDTIANNVSTMKGYQQTIKDDIKDIKKAIYNNGGYNMYSYSQHQDTTSEEKTIQ